MRIVPEGQVVYGMQLPIQSQSRLYVRDWELTAPPSSLVAVAQKADELGFFYVAVCDHVAIPSDRAPRMGAVWYDTIATLGLLAGVTQRVRLMSHVWVAGYRHPLLSAKSFATLDHLSGGRVIIGVGTGHVEGEFAALGVDFAGRGALLDEAISAMDVALRSEFPSFSGSVWSFSDVGVAPRPVQQPRPPIWIGGSSGPALRRAALRGDGWVPQGTPRAEMPASIAAIRSYREAAGLDPSGLDIGTVCEPCYVGTPAWDVGPVARVMLSGPAEAIAESFNEFSAMGVNHLQVRFPARDLQELLDQMEAFTGEVAPLLKA